MASARLVASLLLLTLALGYESSASAVKFIAQTKQQQPATFRPPTHTFKPVEQSSREPHWATSAQVRHQSPSQLGPQTVDTRDGNFRFRDQEGHRIQLDPQQVQRIQQELAAQQAQPVQYIEVPQSAVQSQRHVVIQEAAPVVQQLAQPQPQRQQLQQQPQSLLTEPVQKPSTEEPQKAGVSVSSNVSSINLGNKNTSSYNLISNVGLPAVAANIIDGSGNIDLSKFFQSPSPVSQAQANVVSNGNLKSKEEEESDKKSKKRATVEQEKMKEKLLDLANKALGGPEQDENEPLLRLNKETNTLESVPTDPNAHLYKEKLWEALEVLKPKDLSVKKLKRILNQDDHSSEQLRQAQPRVQANKYQDQERQPAVSYVEQQYAMNYAPRDKLTIEQSPVGQQQLITESWITPEDYNLLDRENLVSQIRANLDDRLNRISDLLYFRPEFMNQLVNVDDARELTPMESEFKRLILCYSNEQFCLPPEQLASLLNQRLQQGLVEEQAVLPVVSNQENYSHQTSASESFLASHSSAAATSSTGSVLNGLQMEPQQQQVHSLENNRPTYTGNNNKINTRESEQQYEAFAPNTDNLQPSIVASPTGNKLLIPTQYAQYQQQQQRIPYQGRPSGQAAASQSFRVSAQSNQPSSFEQTRYPVSPSFTRQQ